MATRIAQVTNSSTSLSGVDRHVASLAAVQAELGFAVTVVTDAPGYLTQACESEIYYVPNGTKAMPSGGVPGDGPPGLMFVGTLGLRKGIDIAILAMYVLRQRLGPQCPLLRVYGDGEQEFFAEMAAVLGLGELVQFCGVQPGILERCPSTDVLIVPSRSETGPIVVLEAMSRGIPVVAADVGEVTEMLPDRRYGRIAPVNSIAAFADAACALLADLAAGQIDPALLIERHRTCYTNDQMARRIAAVYKRVLPT
jgi:glycosyltransferase involved in cell wall biosynthesis